MKYENNNHGVEHEDEAYDTHTGGYGIDSLATVVTVVTDHHSASPKLSILPYYGYPVYVKDQLAFG